MLNTNMNLVLESLPRKRLSYLVERLEVRVDRLPIDPYECDDSISRRMLRMVKDELLRRRWQKW